MEHPVRITILGSVPAQKNDKIIAVNSRTGKRFPMSSPNVKAWQNSAAMQLLQYKGTADRKVTIHYMFYVPNDVARDLDNMIATVNDALVKRGLVKDDSWQWVRLGSADAEIDRKNPRVTLWIEEDPLKEESPSPKATSVV